MPKTIDGDNWSGEPGDGEMVQDVGIGIPLKESEVPAGRKIGLAGLLELVSRWAKERLISDTCYVTDVADDSNPRVQDVQSQIISRYAENRHRQEKHVEELAQLEQAVNHNTLDEGIRRRLDRTRTVLREQAEADIERELAVLARHGTPANMLPIRGSLVRDVADLPVSVLKTSVRAQKALKRHSIETLGELASFSQAELLAKKGIGEQTQDELAQVLASFGLRLREN